MSKNARAGLYACVCNLRCKHGTGSVCFACFPLLLELDVSLILS